MFSIIDLNNVVINYIICDTEDEAKKAYPNYKIIKMTEELTPAYIGGTWNGEKFYPPQPADDYIWDDNADNWIQIPKDTILIDPPLDM